MRSPCSRASDQYVTRDNQSGSSLAAVRAIQGSYTYWMSVIPESARKYIQDFYGAGLQRSIRQSQAVPSLVVDTRPE